METPRAATGLPMEPEPARIATATVFSRDGACFDVYVFRRETEAFNPPGANKQLGKIVIEFINGKFYVGLRDSSTGKWIFNTSVTEHMKLQHNDQHVIGRGTSWLLRFTRPSADPEKYFTFTFNLVNDASDFRFAFAQAQDFEKHRVVPAAPPPQKPEVELPELNPSSFVAELYGDPTVFTDSDSE